MANAESAPARIARLEAGIGALEDQVTGLRGEIVALQQKVDSGPDKYVTRDSLRIAQTVTGVLSVIVLTLIGFLWRLQVSTLERQIEATKTTPAAIAREIFHEMREMSWIDFPGPQPFSQTEQYRLNPRTGGAEAEPAPAAQAPSSARPRE